MLGLGTSMNQTSTSNIHMLLPAREAYFQDSIKVSRNLTVMLGVRWQPYFGYREQYGHLTAWRPGENSSVFPLAEAGMVAVGDPGISGPTFSDRWSNIGPHVSFAWDIFGNGKASVRAGYAWMTDFQVGLPLNNWGSTFPYGLTWSSPTGSLASLKNPYAAYEQQTGIVPFPFQAPTATSPTNSSLIWPNPNNADVFDKTLNSGQIHQWNATFEYSPTKTLMLSIGYVATRGTHLYDRYDQNWAQFVPGNSYYTTASVQARRPYGADGMGMIDTISSDLNSMYNSLQFSFTKRYSHGLTFLGNYTLFSEAQEQPPFSAPNPSNGAAISSALAGPVRYLGDFALDYYNPGINQYFAVGFSYDLPIPTGQSRLAKSIIGGWTFGGSFNGSSGQYGAATDVNCGQFNMGSAGCNAEFVGGNPDATNKGAPQMVAGAQVGISWLNPNKFLRADEVLVNGVPTVSPLVGQRLFLGNANYGVYKGPGRVYAQCQPQQDLSDYRVAEA
jgi:hypothetical protein